LAESIRVDTSVTASSEAAAKTMAQALTADKMNAELSKNNLPNASILEAPSVASPQTQVEIDNKGDAGSGGGVPLVAILVPILGAGVVILAMAYYCIRCRVRYNSVWHSTRKCIHTHTHTHTHTHMRGTAQVYVYTHAHSHTDTHTQTHTYM